MAPPAHNFLVHLKFFKMGKIILSKYEDLMLPRIFPDKVTLDIDCTDEAVVECDFPIVEIILLVLVIYK